LSEGGRGTREGEVERNPAGHFGYKNQKPADSKMTTVQSRRDPWAKKDGQ